MRMLEQEGFTAEGYVDIFDGGPTMSVRTDDIRTINEARELVLTAIDDEAIGKRMMLAAGELRNFACGYGHVAIADDGGATLDTAAARLLGIGLDDRFLAIGR
jgi:arginine N-succinyltransferase